MFNAIYESTILWTLKFFYYPLTGLSSRILMTWCMFITTSAYGWHRYRKNQMQMPSPWTILIYCRSGGWRVRLLSWRRHLHAKSPYSANFRLKIRNSPNFCDEQTKSLKIVDFKDGFEFKWFRNSQHKLNCLEFLKIKVNLHKSVFIWVSEACG